MKFKSILAMILTATIIFTSAPLTLTSVAAEIPQVPAGFSLTPIGRYTWVDPFFDGIATVHKGLIGKLGGNKFGFIDSDGKMITPIQYDYDSTDGAPGVRFHNGMAKVYKYDPNAKPSLSMGFIDKTGKEVVPLGKYQFDIHDPFDYRCFEYGDNNELHKLEHWPNPRYIDREGKELFQPSYDGKVKWLECFATWGSDGYIDKVGYKDQNGKIVVPAKYFSAQSTFHNGRGSINDGDVPSMDWHDVTGGFVGTYLVIDETGKTIFTSKDIEAKLGVKKVVIGPNDITDTAWNVGFPFEYELPTTYKSLTKLTFYGDDFATVHDRGFGYLDMNGNVIWHKTMPRNVGSVHLSSVYQQLSIVDDGVDWHVSTVLIVDTRTGEIIDTHQNIDEFRDIYDDFAFTGSIPGWLYFGKDPVVYDLRTKKNVLPKEYTSWMGSGMMYTFDSGYGVWINGDDPLHTYSEQGPEDTWRLTFANPLPDRHIKVYHNSGDVVAYGKHQKTVQFGMLDENGNQVIDFGRYALMSFYSDGKLLVRSHDDLVGYCDERGVEIIPPTFDVGDAFKNGIAPVGIHVGKSEASPGLAVADEFDWYILRDLNYSNPQGPQQPQPQPQTKPSGWAESQVNQAIALNLVPQQLQSAYTADITRAEFCALAVALYEKYTGKEITERKTFADTQDINVQKMAGLGVVGGSGDGTFNPGGTFDRQMAAVLLVNLLNAMNITLDKADVAFTDRNDIAFWAIEQVGQTQKAELVSGNDGKFNPKGKFTRENGIILMLKLWGYLKE